MPVPSELDAIFDSKVVNLLSTLTKSRVPMTDGMGCFWNDRTVDFGTGLSHPAKGERARANPPCRSRCSPDQLARGTNWC